MEMYSKKFQILVHLLCLVHWNCICASSIADVTSLYSDLLSGYNNHVRPADDQNQPVFVNVTFNLVGIKDFDEVNGKFSVTGYFLISWTDSRMTWDPTLFNHTYTINFPQSKVWKPEITMVNPYKSIKSIGHDFLSVTYTADGHAYWSPGDVLDSLCTVNIKYYPFDKQSCQFNFVVWGTSSAQVKMNVGDPKVGMTYFMQHGTWKLDNAVASEVDDGTSYIAVTLHMSRRPLFTIVNIILPILFMSVLNLLVFILPVESGERVSYAITVLLAIAVFMTLVGDHLPKTSEPMPLLSYFLMIDLVISALICMFTIVGLHMYFKSGNDPVPSMMRKLVNCFSTRYKRLPKNNIADVTLNKSKKEEYLDKKKTGCEEEMLKITWKMVAKSLDMLVLTIGVLWTIITFIVFFAIITNN